MTKYQRYEMRSELEIAAFHAWIAMGDILSHWKDGSETLRTDLLTDLQIQYHGLSEALEREKAKNVAEKEKSR